MDKNQLHAKIEELYYQGKTDYRIGKELGIPPWESYHWRKGRGLPPVGEWIPSGKERTYWGDPNYPRPEYDQADDGLKPNWLALAACVLRDKYLSVDKSRAIFEL